MNFALGGSLGFLMRLFPGIPNFDEQCMPCA